MTTIDDFEVTVEHEHQDAPGHQFWVGVMDDQHEEIAKRRAIIMRRGLNKIHMKWTVIAGYAAYAGLWLSQTERHPWYTAPVLNPRRISAGDAATLDWNITHSEPIYDND